MGTGASGDASIATPLCGFTPPTVVLPPTPRTAVSMFKSCLVTISISNRNSSVTRVRNRASRRNKSHLLREDSVQARVRQQRRAPDSRRTPLRRLTTRPASTRPSLPARVSSRRGVPATPCGRAGRRRRRTRRGGRGRRAKRRAKLRRGPRVLKTRLGASTGRHPARPRGCAARRSPLPSVDAAELGIVILVVPLDVPVVVVEAPARAAGLAGARGGGGRPRRPAAAAHAPVRERGDAAHGVRLRARGRHARAPEPAQVRGETHGHARRAHRQVGEHRTRARQAVKPLSFSRTDAFLILDDCPSSQPEFGAT